MKRKQLRSGFELLRADSISRYAQPASNTRPAELPRQVFLVNLVYFII